MASSNLAAASFPSIRDTKKIKTPFQTGHTGSRANRSTESTRRSEGSVVGDVSERLDGSVSTKSVEAVHCRFGARCSRRDVGLKPWLFPKSKKRIPGANNNVLILISLFVALMRTSKLERFERLQDESAVLNDQSQSRGVFLLYPFPGKFLYWISANVRQGQC